jgi:hypothetical protein
MVQQYDYILDSRAFQEYCSNRGVLHVAGEPESTRWRFMADYTRAKPAFLSDPYFQRSQEVDGKRYCYSEQEMEIHWTIVALGRARLQDCWELFAKANQPTL